MRPRVLVADDESQIRIALRKIIDEMGCDVTPVCDGRQALEALGRGAYQLIVTDLRMPEADGLQVVAAAAEHKVPVVVLTGYATIDSAVEAMRLGATDFLTKPFEVHQVERVVRAALGSGAAPSRASSSGGGARSIGGLGGGLGGGIGGGRPASGSLRRTQDSGRPQEQTLIGDSPAMEEVRALVARIADSDGTVLLTGESGTGKEVVAHLIHERSRRAGGPFIAVNCAAIPEQLLESELFGHTRGSFTGATQPRTGRFTQAAGGTLFLDEIAEMSPALQAKVLRVLQDKEVTPVGASRPQRVDVRIIAATNRDLRDMVAQDRFRDDLYYRLYVLPIHLPPLRERPSDLPALCEHFLARAFARRGETPPPLREVLSAEAMERLRAHPFPGNVRELENMIERIIHLRQGGQVLGPAELPLEPQRVVRNRPASGGLGGAGGHGAGGGGTFGPGAGGHTAAAAHLRGDAPEWLAASCPPLPDDGVDLRDQMESIEKSLIAQALQRAGGSRKVAAELLRIKRTTLVMKMMRHRIDEAGRPVQEEPEDGAQGRDRVAEHLAPAEPPARGERPGAPGAPLSPAGRGSDESGGEDEGEGGAQGSTS